MPRKHKITDGLPIDYKWSAAGQVQARETVAYLGGTLVSAPWYDKNV